jgi:hypothetical protein
MNQSHSHSRRGTGSLPEGVKVEMVTEDQMTEEDKNSVFNREQTVDAIPDLDKLTWNVFKILEYLESPATLKHMRTKTNIDGVRMLLNNKYADEMPLGIIDMLLEEESREENVERILQMITHLRQAKREGNERLKALEEIFVEDVKTRYAYDEYGSKEAFEKALSKEIEKEQRKNKNNNNQSTQQNIKNVHNKMVINN